MRRSRRRRSGNSNITETPEMVDLIEAIDTLSDDIFKSRESDSSKKKQ